MLTDWNRVLTMISKRQQREIDEQPRERISVEHDKNSRRLRKLEGIREKHDMHA